MRVRFIDIVDKPTQKQLDFIDVIEHRLDAKFEGTTKTDATEFISKWADLYYLYEELWWQSLGVNND